MSATDIVRMT